MDPRDGIVGVNDPLTIDGRCSEGGANLLFRYDLGDGCVKEGQAFVSAVWSQSGIYDLTLTVTRSSSFGHEEDSFTRRVTVERPADLVVADFTGSAQTDTCRATFDGSRSTGDIVDYLWELDLRNDFRRGVVTAQGQVVQHDWGQDCFRAQGVLLVRLTVVGRNGSGDSLQKEVRLFGLRPFLDFADSVLTSSVTTELRDSNGGGARGQVVLGGSQTHSIGDGGHSSLGYSARAGRNSLEAWLTVPLDSPARWRFDFSDSPHFVPGSLRVVAGQEVSRDGYAVVVRLSGNTSERVRIDYALEP